MNKIVFQNNCGTPFGCSITFYEYENQNHCSFGPFRIWASKEEVEKDYWLNNCFFYQYNEWRKAVKIWKHEQTRNNQRNKSKI